MKDEDKSKEDLMAEIESLKQEIAKLKDDLVKIVSRNIELTERMEENTELQRRIEVARELLEGNVQRQQNADLQDDGQLMALLEIKLEKDKPHLNADFGATQLAEMLGVSLDRLNRLFRHQTIHRTPESYIDNVRVLTALRLLREKPKYNIAFIAEDAGFKHVRTMQRRIMDVVGMTPAEYRALFTKDLID